MTAYNPKPQDVYDLSIDALDAAFMLYCRDHKSFYASRREEIPGKLIIYKITDATKASENRLVGEVRFQFVSGDRTRISFDTPNPFPPTWEPGKWVNQDAEFLRQICTTVISGLTQPLLSNKKYLQRNLPGKPPLSQDELILRMASARLEEYLQAKDKGVTRGEVVLLAKEEFHIITTISKIKDGKQRLGDARWRNDKALLDDVDELLNTWLRKASS